MNKTDLVEKIVKATKLTKKDSDKALTAIIGAISGALAKGEKVQLVGFGSFEVRKRAARKGRNPQTGKEISIAARKVPVFKAGKALKDAVGKK
ncbi:MAG TPA: HU family DNA-binding protein [Bacillota bacterium]|nr:HU family DNA-binding protein [Bacillota bacterium]